MAEKKTKHVDVTVERAGVTISIPPDMKLEEAKLWIERKQQEEETVIQLQEVIEGFPLDAAYCLQKAIAKEYGFRQAVATTSFFGDKPPAFMTVPINSNGDTVDILVGEFKLPNISGTFSIHPLNTHQMALSGKIKQKDKEKVHRLLKKTREFLKTDSLYKGKAVRIYTDPSDGEMQKAPEFLDLNLNPEDLILDAEIEAAIAATVWAPILYTERCRVEGTKRKRGILVEGPPGVGKTLLMHITAKIATEKGWTVLYSKDVRSFAHDYEMAKRYQPCLLVAEDMDLLSPHEQNVFLNTLDGIDSKSVEIITFFTSNYPENIDQRMLRPGRIDSVLPVRAPSEDAVIRLVKKYGRSDLAPTVDFTAVAKKLAGKIPAVIQEVLEMAKLRAMHRIKGVGKIVIDTDDLLSVVFAMEHHLALMTREKPKPMSALELGSSIIGDYIAVGIRRAMEGATQISSTSSKEMLMRAGSGH